MRFHYTKTNPIMTTSHNNSPQLRVTVGPDTTPTTRKKIRGFFRETEDDIMEEPRTTNSNNTQNETTPTQPIPKTIMENEKNPTNIQNPIRPGEATHRQILQQGYNPLTITTVPVSSHNLTVPTTLNALHKRKLQQISSSPLAPFSTAYNAINDQCTDGTLTIDKLEMILMCLRNIGEYSVIDLITNTKFTPDQKEATITGNLDIKMEATTTGMFGTPPPPPHLMRTQARQWQPRIQLNPPRNKPVRGAIDRNNRNRPQQLEKAVRTEQRLLPAKTTTRPVKNVTATLAGTDVFT
jgi:hypothetical protein